jgi:hypothetical protein
MMSGKPPKLRPGKGAKATVLTRFIKPKQPLPDGNTTHRSDVVVLGHFTDEKGRLCFTLSFDMLNEAEEDVTQHLYAIKRYVKIVEEGPPANLFDENLISWEDSEARKLLYKDLSEGIVPLDGDKNDTATIYAMRPDYAKYDVSMFANRLAALRDVVAKAMNRKKKDKEAFDLFVLKNDVSLSTFAGFPQWKSSAARDLALVDIKNGVHEKLGFRKMFSERPEYYEHYPFEYWRDRVKQEISMSKYLHTLKINNGRKLVTESL